MNGWFANTDYDWYRYLSGQGDLEEINFWQPSGGRAFRILSPGEPLLFKLKSPHNAVAGFGHFVRHSVLPAWLAWDAFGHSNGAPDFPTMRRRIEKYRRNASSDPDAQYLVGCLILAEPVLFPRELWIPQPRGWPRSAVQGKTYPLDHGEGQRVWEHCLANAQALGHAASSHETGVEKRPRYGKPVQITPRLGQGTFRVVVMESYGRACAVSSEHSLPALEAAHIRPYKEGGEHRIGNGILLRSDIHRLFDKGYMTITPDHRIEVSRRLKDDFDNGKSYYPFNGSRLILPDSSLDEPDPAMIEWHNENQYLG